MSSFEDEEYIQQGENNDVIVDEDGQWINIKATTIPTGYRDHQDHLY